jgi:uncharacterized protein DUF1706
MTDTITKRQLLEGLDTARANWEALLRQVGPDRMELRGVNGEWSIKDVVAHVTAWDRRSVASLKAVQTGAWPEPPEWPVNLDEDGVNAWIFAANRGRRVQDALNESRQVFNQLAQALDLVTEQDLTAVGRFGWLAENSLAASIRGNSLEHYQIHGAAIRAWLAERDASFHMLLRS